jgi:hypothetical protein
MAGMVEPIWRNVEPSAQAPLQFGIRDLLIAQAVCAVCLGLVAAVGAFGLMAIFVATLVFCFIPVQPCRTKLKRCIIDLMGGIVLPAIFFVCTVEDAAPAFGFVAIAFQMLALLTWLVVGSRLGRCKAVVAGTLFVGGLISGLLASTFFFLGVFALMYYGLGLLFFIPILTCYAFLGNMADAMRQARTDQGKWTARLLFWMGIVLAIAIPILVDAMAGSWLDAAIKSAPWPHRPWIGNSLGAR